MLEPGFQYWFSGEDACLAYVDTGGAWVAAGGPIASADRLAEVALAFVAAAAQQGRRVCFFATEERFVRETSFAALAIGEQPSWSPQRWDETLHSSRSLREQLRRARAKNVSVRCVAEEELRAGPMRLAIEQIVQSWLRSRPMAPMGFLVQLHLFSFQTERRFFLAEQGDKAVGFLNAVPIYGRQGWLLEDVLRDPAAPNGTSELLIDSAMRSAAAEQAQYVTTGLVPLAGGSKRWMRASRFLGSAFYDFRGVRAFRAKLRPNSWSPVFLSYPARSWAVVALVDSLRAFAQGNFLRFGVATLLRGPVWLVRVMTLLLVPWIVLLASGDPHRWFPSVVVQRSWIVFDLLLLLALLRLTARWQQPLATLLACLVTMDAVLTLAEAVFFNLPRASSLAGWIVPALAVLAPSVAALILWRARTQRSRTLPPQARLA